MAVRKLICRFPSCGGLAGRSLRIDGFYPRPRGGTAKDGVPYRWRRRPDGHPGGGSASAFLSTPPDGRRLATPWRRPAARCGFHQRLRMGCDILSAAGWRAPSPLFPGRAGRAATRGSVLMFRSSTAPGVSTHAPRRRASCLASLRSAAISCFYPRLRMERDRNTGEAPGPPESPPQRKSQSDLAWPIPP